MERQYLEYNFLYIPDFQNLGSLPYNQKRMKITKDKIGETKLNISKKQMKLTIEREKLSK